MRIISDVFGEIEVKKEAVIRFEEGIPGFEEEKQFVFMENKEKDSPFFWMQSVQTPELAFVMMDPFQIYKDYDLELSDTVLNKLHIRERNEVAVYSMVVIPEDPKQMTTNLQGPIVINFKEGLGKQVILDDDRWKTRHYILDASGRGE